MVWVVALLDNGVYPPQPDSKAEIFCIRSLVKAPRHRRGKFIKYSTPKDDHFGLYLNIFRGEPAIARFD